MKRIDALGDRRSERLEVATGRVLDPALDEVLQAMVTEAASALKIPIALVSLVLKRTQYFRAHTGLPADLAIARATDRDASFCQFVVRDGVRFEVTDAAKDARVPQELVERYGIAAYIGEPVKVAGEVIGSLCGIDVVARTFSEDDRRHLASLAAKVSVRLEQLREAGPTPRALASLVRPAFGELRNVLAALIPAAQAARVSAADLAPLVRIVEQLRHDARFPALAGLTGAVAAFGELEELLAIAADSTRKLEQTVYTLESLLTGGRGEVAVAELITLAERLAHHQLKLIGGVRWEPIDPTLTVAATRPLAVSAVGTALGMIAAAQQYRPAAIIGRAVVGPTQVSVELTSEAAAPAALAAAVTELSELFEPGPLLSFSLARGGLSVQLARPSGPRR